MENRMDRVLWESIEGFVELSKFPLLPCPYCHSHNLAVMQESFNYSFGPAPLAEEEIQRREDLEVAKGKEVFSASENPEGELTLGGVALGVLFLLAVASNAYKKGVAKPAKFITFLKCDDCNGHVSATGTAIINKPPMTTVNSPGAEEDAKAGVDLPSAMIKFEYFSPPLPIFRLSQNVPEPVRTEMLQAFNHIHADPSSSGSKLRRALEKFCDSLGVREKTLHLSIEKLKESYPREAKLFMALKMLGNEAVHSDLVGYSDLLDALEVQKFALKIFDRLHEEKSLDEKAARLWEKFS